MCGLRDDWETERSVVVFGLVVLGGRVDVRGGFILCSFCSLVLGYAVRGWLGVLFWWPIVSLVLDKRFLFGCSGFSFPFLLCCVYGIMGVLDGLVDLGSGSSVVYGSVIVS